MDKIAFYGSIWSGDYKAVASVLQNWVNTDKLDIKIRLNGEEIIYEDDQIYLYCYNAVTDKVIAPSFLLEGNMYITLEQIKLLLQKLQQLYTEKQIMSNFEYVKISEDGEQLGEEFYVK